MRRLLLAAILLLLSPLALKAQGGNTTVIATIRDPGGNIYSNSQVNISFFDPGTSGKLPLLNGSTFQVTYTGYATNSSGVMPPISLADNGAIGSGSGATGTQWIFSVCFSDRVTCFQTKITINCAANIPATCTVNTIDISAALQAASAPVSVVTQPASLTGNNAFSGNNIFSGSNTHSGAETFTQFSGCQHVNSLQTLTAALAAAGSPGCVLIDPGTYTVTASLAMVTGLDIECSPNNATILQASATLNAPMFTGNNVNNFRMGGCVIDGNRAGNANQFSAMSLTAVTKSKIVNNHFQNFSGGRVIGLLSGSNGNTIQDNEINNYAPILPAQAIGNECIGLAPVGSGAGVQDNDIIHNFCHDGNSGIGLLNSNAAPSATTNTSNNRILFNKLQANANDCIYLFSSSMSGSLIQGNLFEGNNIRGCGWPANGTGWDSANYPPGLLQTGATASSSGVCIDGNSGLMDQNQFIGNRGAGCFFEGGDDNPETHTIVNTSNGALGTCTANCVQSTSGDGFLTTWKPNQGVIIGASQFLISSVQSATVLTLTTAPGTQTGVALTGAPCSRDIWKGNTFFSNGNGAPLGGQGSGLAIQGCEVTSEGNLSYNNAFGGFIDQIAASVKHVGDTADSNCRIQNCQEFLVQAALNPLYSGITTNARSSSNAFFLDTNTNNAFIESPSVCNSVGTCGSSQITDNSINGRFSDGRTRGAGAGSASQCFNAGGGTGCLNYGGGAGAFNATTPAANTMLAGLAVAQTWTANQTNIPLVTPTIGGGTALNLYKTVTDTPGAITVNTLTCTDRSVALAGSGTGAIIGIAANYAIETNLILTPAQAVAGTVHYRICNFTAANITLNAAATFNLAVIQ